MLVFFVCALSPDFGSKINMSRVWSYPHLDSSNVIIHRLVAREFLLLLTIPVTSHFLYVGFIFLISLCIVGIYLAWVSGIIVGGFGGCCGTIRPRRNRCGNEMSPADLSDMIPVPLLTSSPLECDVKHTRPPCKYIEKKVKRMLKR